MGVVKVILKQFNIDKEIVDSNLYKSNKASIYTK